jgi:hypothetical protein
MDKKIENILSLYENILTNKSLIISEADIRGIDELVYNPATKEGGEIGHGYNDGKRVEGITWKNHDTHLHIGFTDRETAIAVIEKAFNMGLITSENPYAKTNPRVGSHTQGSLHYKKFPGDPVVGMAVDITGEKTKIIKLIKWIDETYTDYSSDSETNDIDLEDSPSGGLLSTFATNIAKTILPVDTKIDVRKFLGVKENIKRIKNLL